MQTIIDFIVSHSAHAPWMVFGMILLAGFNLPISVDVIMVLTAFLAATMIPESTIPLYLSIVFGAYFSAWIAYWFGRGLGSKLLKFRFFAKLLPPDRLLKIEAFYNKHGFLTLLFGRFIPFGIRNCIFMTAGMSRAHFGKFAFRDLVACFVWVTTCFYTFYSLGLNYQLLRQRVQMINIAIFLAFSVTVIGVVWYKKRKKRKASLKLNQEELIDRAESSE